MSSKVRSFDGQSLVSLVIAEVSRGAGGSSGRTLLYRHTVSLVIAEVSQAGTLLYYVSLSGIC